jgi:hypothetical protein
LALILLKKGIAKRQNETRKDGKSEVNDAHCVENGFPTETFGNDGIGDLWIDGKFILGGQTLGSAPTSLETVLVFEVNAMICFILLFTCSSL